MTLEYMTTRVDFEHFQINVFLLKIHNDAKCSNTFSKVCTAVHRINVL